MCPHRAIVSLLPPPASNQCGVGAVCVPIELLSAYFLLLPPISVEWCRVCPHRAIVSLLPPPTSNQCGVGAECVAIYGSESGGVWNMV